VLAKKKSAASDLSLQIKNRSTRKYYYALCYGNPKADKEKLSDFMIRRQDTGLADIVSEDEKETLKDGAILINGEKVNLMGGDVKKAELEYEVIGRTEKTALLRVHLITGRFHQIRAQLSKRGFPIIGDEKYGSAESISYAKEQGIKELCLVSYSFSFKHPGTKKKVTYEITPDNREISSILKNL
jgi:23S rRNA pseudouridine1911/1915/1917 synthase